MWRSMFLGAGIFLMILGAECLAVESVTLKIKGGPAPADGFLATLDNKPGPSLPKKFVPESWIPWSLLSTGAVVCLYSFTIPRRIQGK